jgi:hypothetical protein
MSTETHTKSTTENYSLDTREISKIIDLSTAHVTLETNNLLEESDSDPAGCLFPGAVYSIQYGFYIYISQDEILDGDFDEQYPVQFKDLIRFLASQGINNVRLDRDGAFHDGLPTYEW